MSASVSLRQMAGAVRSGERTATASVADAMTRIANHDPAIGAVTRLLDERATRDAAAIDARIAAGAVPGPLAGIPFGVKDLFDVAGVTTTAGSRLRSADSPATRDAEAVRRLCAAGAVPVATLNMDEFAYGFSTVNANYGTTRNPRDLARLAGGSSGGSAAAVAAGLLPLTLGSDTNGSIRVPAALCGVYGLKPTHGSLPMAGVAPFAESFDDIGPIAAGLDDLQLAFEVLRGTALAMPDGRTLRIGRLGGWFARNQSDAVAESMTDLADALDAPLVEWTGAEAARSAAFLVTAAEGGALHLPDLRRDPLAFDPAVRDRLIAGAMVPASTYRAAKALLVRLTEQVTRLFDRFDVLLAPATGDVAPPLDDQTVPFAGGRAPARSHLGIFTQPLSAVGLPVLCVPLERGEGLPLGAQLVGPPGSEHRLFACARRMLDAGLLARPEAVGG